MVGTNPSCLTSRGRFQWTPLHTACAYGHLEAVKKIVELQKKKDKKEPDGSNPKDHPVNLTELLDCGSEAYIGNPEVMISSKLFEESDNTTDDQNDIIIDNDMVWYELHQCKIITWKYYSCFFHRHL